MMTDVEVELSIINQNYVKKNHIFHSIALKVLKQDECAAHREYC